MTGNTDTSPNEGNHELANDDTLRERLEKIDLEADDTCSIAEARERLGLTDGLRRGYVDHWPGRQSAAVGTLTDQPAERTQHE